MEGRSQDAAPMTRAGVVLSQPAISTTPSIGLPRIDSSTSMEARLRKSMAVGRRLDSPQEKTGNSSGSPPASSTPALICSTSPRKCALQGVNSEKVLQMPITGRPSKASSGRPLFFIQLRWMKASLPCPPNQCCERRFVTLPTPVSVHRACGHLTAPMVRPRINCFWKTRTNSSTGTSNTIEAADSSPQRTCWYPTKA